MWDDDEDEESRPYKKPPKGLASSVLLWLFFETTLRVLLPAIGCMLIGIWLGNKLGHKQGVAIIGTLVGLFIAGMLIWQQAKTTKNR